MRRLLLFLLLPLTCLGADPFSFLYIPDWQIVTSNQWRIAADNIIASNTSWNLKAVICSGDVVDTGTSEQWITATTAVYRVAADVPFLLVPGNHDSDDQVNRSYTAWNTYFGTDYYTSKEWWTGGFANESDSSEGVYLAYTNSTTDKWVFVGLQDQFTTNQAAWASNIIYTLPDHKAVIFTHEFLNANGTLFTNGDTYTPYQSGAYMPANAWPNTFQPLSNIRLVLSGHDLNNYSRIKASSVASGSGPTALLQFYNPQLMAFPWATGMRLFTVDADSDRLTWITLAGYPINLFPSTTYDLSMYCRSTNTASGWRARVTRTY